jgi:hypothetical protein
MGYLGSIVQDTLRAKYKGCEYVCGETYESLLWMESNTTPKPTEEQLKLDIADYEANRAKYDYVYLRMGAYPGVTEQLDMLWHAMDKGILTKVPEFYNAIKTVKDKYPKE